jgi:RHS repeat-associated protein
MKNKKSTIIPLAPFGSFWLALATWTQTADRHYLYDGWNVIAEYEGSGGTGDSPVILARTHIWGTDLSGTEQGAGGVGGLLATRENSQMRYYTYDGNGNVSEVLDASGTAQAHYEYDPFGNLTVSTGAWANTNVWRFSTKPFDTAAGLYYYGLRFYDSTLGRWTNRDPLGEYGGLNLHGFIYNSPINSIDAYGLWELRFSLDKRVNLLSRGYLAFSAKAGISNGNGYIDISIGGGARIFLSELLGGVGGVMIGVILEKMNILQEGRLGITGNVRIQASCPSGSSYLRLKVTRATASLGVQILIGYQSQKIRALGQLSGAGQWDLLTGNTYLTGTIGVRLQMKNGTWWKGWDYTASGQIPLPFRLPKISAPVMGIGLPENCECMTDDMDGSSLLNGIL